MSADLADAQAEPFRVLVEGWSATSVAEDGVVARVRLVAAQDGYAIDLPLTNTRSLVFHGDCGLSQKSPNPGNASYYYSMTRLATEGWVTTPRGTFAVRRVELAGSGMVIIALDDDTAGWGWFSLRFDDQRAIMFFKLCRKETIEANFAYIDADGRTVLIRHDEAHLIVLERWTSPQARELANYCRQRRPVGQVVSLFKVAG